MHGASRPRAQAVSVAPGRPPWPLHCTLVELVFFVYRAFPGKCYRYDSRFVNIFCVLHQVTVQLCMARKHVHRTWLLLSTERAAGPGSLGCPGTASEANVHCNLSGIVRLCPQDSSVFYRNGKEFVRNYCAPDYVCVHRNVDNNETCIRIVVLRGSNPAAGPHSRAWNTVTFVPWNAV